MSGHPRAPALLAVALLAVLALAAPAPARANGDPASDVLLRDDAFFPYVPQTSKRLSTAVTSLLKRARTAGYPMKVAMVQTPQDLGSYPEMFTQPNAYASLLSRELTTLRHGSARKEPLHLLVIMPSGFSGSNLGDRVDEALAPVKVDPDNKSDGLAQAALAAVARLATVNGHPLPVPPEASAKLPRGGGGQGGGGIASSLIYVLPVALVAAFALASGVLARRRAQTAGGDAPAAASVGLGRPVAGIAPTDEADPDHERADRDQQHIDEPA